MITIEQMKYRVIKDISSNAKEGDILTVGWNEDEWALFKNGKYVCDLTSHYGTRYCEAINPEV
jgi:hypothetical protein